jgi:1-deoxy-D-xylulose-5-phosphate synthase
MRSLPNMVVMAPKDENELQHMLKTALQYSGPITLRYPRGEGLGVDLDDEIRTLDIGRAELLREGKDLVIIGIGDTVIPGLKAAEDLFQLGIDAAVVNARFVKPLDRQLFVELLAKVPTAITVENHNLYGGFGSALLELLADEGLRDVNIKRLGVPDRFISHGTQDQLKKLCGFDEEGIVHAALQTVRGEKKRKKDGWERGSV